MNGNLRRAAFPASLCLVEKQLIGLNLFRKGNCFPLPRIEVFKPPIWTVTERPYLKPRGRTGNPGLYRLRSFRLLEFFEYGRGNQNPPKELRKHVGMINEDQVVQWRRVGDDDHAV